MIGRALLALAASSPLVAAAHAGGSLGLVDVQRAVAKAPIVVAEINAELVKNNLKVAEVICTAARHGNHWRFLGGSRAAPYECEIGKRSISIDADRIYFDSKGKSLGGFDKADPKRARTFREDNFSWTWAP